MTTLDDKYLNTNSFQQRTKTIINDFNIVIKNKKLNWRIMLWFGILWFIIFVYMVIRLLLVISDLNSKSKFLLNLDSYDTRLLQNNIATRNLLEKNWKISSIIKIHTDATSEIEKYSQYINDLNVPYENLLQYIYLPHLNIWKNVYTNKIDLGMIWKNFLEKNPYNDIFLLQKRSDFFKNMGNSNEWNDIKNIQIWAITETNEDGFFHIPISLSFEANSKRSFLLLVDKISVTSNKVTLSLINEFFYYLRQEIVTNKKDEIQSLRKAYMPLYFSWEEIISDDKIIWFNIYNRVYNNEENALIDENIIDQTIKKIVYCDKEWDEFCYYKFREKYRDIPTFGYLIWWVWLKTNVVENFRSFLLSLPPIFSVSQFNFNQADNLDTDSYNRKYKWNITIDVYGKWITTEELDEIAITLGTSCYGKKSNNQILSVENALEKVSEAIEWLSDIDKSDKSQWTNLRELKTIFEKTSTEFAGYSNYKKIVKLFEVYRMLKNIGLCK